VCMFRFQAASKRNTISGADGLRNESRSNHGSDVSRLMKFTRWYVRFVTSAAVKFMAAMSSERCCFC
jgi:hypothetical protein